VKRISISVGPEDAVTSLLQAVQLKPESLDLHDLLGRAYFRVGNREAARLELQTVLELNPLFDGELMKLLNSRNDLSKS
jgi:tetratricopeptide (TPR) repeat protein